MFEREPKDWRELLGWIANDPENMQRLIQSLGVRDITIKRWVRRESEPRPQNLRRLLTAVPEYRDQFAELIPQEFEDFTDSVLDDSHQEIPAKFYAEIFQMRGTIGPTQAFWSLTTSIINQALNQLDPEHLGMAITAVKCLVTARPDRKILSLRETLGQGSGPWPANLEQTAMLLEPNRWPATWSQPATLTRYKTIKTIPPGCRDISSTRNSVPPLTRSSEQAGSRAASSAPVSNPTIFSYPAA